MRDDLDLAWNWGHRQLMCESDCKDLVDVVVSKLEGERNLDSSRG